MKMAVFWDVAPSNLVEVHRRFKAIALMMGAASTSETSVKYQTTRHNTPEYSSLLITVRLEAVGLLQSAQTFSMLCRHISRFSKGFRQWFINYTDITLDIGPHLR
jgi:hypothetical protein